tara:strand:+ start:429 stop:2642 length:2214 start_codon:yes stop_codon:yes gene_type:complete
MSRFESVIKDKEKIVITAALPYANGTVHIGHLLEYLQTDIYTRFLKLLQKDAIYICASDMHGTPIVINAKKENTSPINFATKKSVQQQKDFALFNINFDNFSNTHSEINKELSLVFFKTLKEKDLIYTKDTEQMYDEKAEQFLPDRFIKGTCPKCQAEDQYGDVCEKCGATYETTDLINPKSALTGTTPVIKTSTHYFFKLSQFTKQIETWINDPNSALQPEVKNFVQNWVNQGLKDWCISRDAPYFGFEIPKSEEETGNLKYFYVWLDAPIGYISSTEDFCKNKLNSLTLSWKDYWIKENSHIQHFIGKDIMYFHLLFWPAMLLAMDIPLPVITVHGFITVDGQKMSKSRGTFFTAREFHELYGSSALRFYFAKHLDRSVTDINLDFKDFAAVTNNVLVANPGNFCYRTLSFVAKRYPEGLPKAELSEKDRELIKKVRSETEKVTAAYAHQNIKAAVNHILRISDLGNVFFQDLEPWKKRETEGEENDVMHSLTVMVNLARNLSILLKPILPNFSAKIERSFGPDTVLANNKQGLLWKDLSFSWHGTIKTPERLIEKIEITQTKSKGTSKEEETKIDKDSFPADIRVGEIFHVEDHPDANKLFVLQVDFGEEFGKRQIIAGIKDAFTKDQLQGKRACFLINLQPATIRGVESKGMTLVAEESKEKYNLLWVENSIELGSSAIFEGKTQVLPEIDFKTFGKYKLKVLDHKVLWNNIELCILGQPLLIPGVKDGARIR